MARGIARAYTVAIGDSSMPSGKSPIVCSALQVRSWHMYELKAKFIAPITRI
jgi:hypothetical protein